MEDRFFENSIDMICFLDFNGYFRRVNPAWERTLGYTSESCCPADSSSSSTRRSGTHAQPERGGKSWWKALSFENRYRCKDGSYKWLRWNAAPDAPENVIYGIARDITESKRAEESASNWFANCGPRWRK